MEADAVCGAGYGERSPERVNTGNGYRHRGFDTRAGTLDVAIPKLRERHRGLVEAIGATLPGASWHPLRGT